MISNLKEAMFYEKIDDTQLKCNLCNHRCSPIANYKSGICGVRKNIEGKLYSLVYGKAIACSVDPIEKKPLFNFLPGSKTYSIATMGCNFRCDNCQNYDISQSSKEMTKIVGKELSAEVVVSEALHYNCESIAYTYSEPTIFYEYAYDIAKIAKKNGLNNIFVTNGYITPEALRKIHPYLDAANIDLKSFNNKVYKKNFGANLQPVLDSIKLYKKLGIWIEITTLIIPTINDSDDELQQIAEFIKNELSENTPWHVSAFYPTYKLKNIPRTSIKTLNRARQIGLNVGLRYVYEGNIPGELGENTYCHNCKQRLIHRFGYKIQENKIKNSKCVFCSEIIDGIF